MFIGKKFLEKIQDGWGALTRPQITLALKIKALKSFYKELDEEIDGFRCQIRLSCPTGCGHCCENPRIQTTELEMLPMAAELVRTGEAEKFYEAADRLDFDGRCVFYESTPGRPGMGRCTQYALRPTICRLFAFSANTDKYGNARLVSCAIIKQVDPQSAEMAAEMVEKGKAKPPMMAACITKASMADPELSREQLPINMALKRAIDRVWLHHKFGE